MSAPAATPALSDESKAKLKTIFELFDTDGSGKIDAKEMMEMMESMGIVASEKAVIDMIRAVDTDGNDEIDFEELCTIAANNSQTTTKGSTGVSFAAVFDRKKNAGPPQLWRDDKMGVGMTLGAAKREVTHKGAAWGVQLIDLWLSTAKFDTGSVILSVDDLNGECFIGATGVNFNGMEWDCPLGASKEKPGTAPWCAVQAKDGQVFFKGRGTEQKMCKLEKGDRFAFSVEMHHARMSCKVLRRDPKMKVDPPVWMEISEVTIDNIHNEVAIAVAFGETAEGQESKVRIVGSSCEKTAKPGGASQKSEAEQRGNIIMDEETKMSLSMQM